MNDPQSPIVTAAKVAPTFATAAAAGIGHWTWGELAAMLGSLYTICLLAHWWWRIVWRPLLERRGVLKPKKRAKYVQLDTDNVPLP